MTMTAIENQFQTTTPQLTILFPSTAAANTFKEWLCEAGEQSYWDWCDVHGHACNFEYHNPGGAIIHATEAIDE